MKKSPSIVKKAKIYTLAFSFAIVTYHLWLYFACNSQLGTVQELAFAVIALSYAIFIKKFRKQLAKVPYLLLAINVFTYFITNVSFWIHAFVASSVKSGFVLTANWYGAIISMPLIWGVGLAIHAIESVSNKGYDSIEF